MNTQVPVSTASARLAPEFAGENYGALPSRSVSWGAILAGVAAAIALQSLFMMLGAGLGFAAYNPLTDDQPVADFGKGAAVIHGVSAVLSLFFGGWVAGRLTPSGIRSTGWLHGFAVWCTSTVVGILVVALGAGWAISGLSKVVGGGLALAGQPAAQVAGQATADAENERSTELVGGFVDEALGYDEDRTPAENFRAKRQITLAVTRYFNPLQENNRASNRTALITALTENGVAAPVAERTVNEWTEAYDELKADLLAVKEQAAAKAKEVAEEAAQALTIYSLCMFVGFAMGAGAAAWGGHAGVIRARRYEERMNNLRA